MSTFSQNRTVMKKELSGENGNQIFVQFLSVAFDINVTFRKVWLQYWVSTSQEIVAMKNEFWKNEAILGRHIFILQGVSDGACDTTVTVRDSSEKVIFSCWFSHIISVFCSKVYFSSTFSWYAKFQLTVEVPNVPLDLSATDKKEACGRALVAIGSKFFGLFDWFLAELLTFTWIIFLIYW